MLLIISRHINGESEVNLSNIKNIYGIEFSNDKDESFLDRNMYSSMETIETLMNEEGYAKKKDSSDNTFFEKECYWTYAEIRKFTLVD